MPASGRSLRLLRLAALALLPLVVIAAGTAAALVEGDHALAGATLLVVPAPGGEASLRVGGELTLGGDLDLLFAAAPRAGVYRIYQSPAPARGRVQPASLPDAP